MPARAQQTANEAWRDLAIRQRRWLVNLENRQVARIFKVLRDMEQRMVGRIVEYLGSDDPQTWLTAARQAQLLRDLRETLDFYFPRLQSDLEATLRETARAEADLLLERLERAMAVLPDPVSIFRVPERMLVAMATDFLPKNPAAGVKPVVDRIADMPARVQARVARVLVDGVARGDDAAKVAAAVRKVVGPQSITAHEAATIARTQLQRVANDVARAFYYENRDLVPGVQVIATLDKRTCLQCAALDGREFPNGEAPVLPLHPQCRCFTIPVLASWREMGIPASKASPETRRLFDGQPADRVSYEDWLRGQDEDVQRKILGASRFDDWSKGKAELADFATDRRILTVEEYRRRAA